MEDNDSKYRVECCNSECNWEGFSTDCVTPKHESDHLLCPKCYEVVEPMEF